MAVDGIFVDAVVAESGRNPVSKYLSLSVDNERADTGQDDLTRLARPNFQA